MPGTNGNITLAVAVVMFSSPGLSAHNRLNIKQPETRVEIYMQRLERLRSEVGEERLQVTAGVSV